MNKRCVDVSVKCTSKEVIKFFWKNTWLSKKVRFGAIMSEALTSSLAGLIISFQSPMKIALLCLNSSFNLIRSMRSLICLISLLSSEDP